MPPACVFYIQFLYVFLMTTKESVSVHRMQRFCEGGVEVGWGRGFFPTGRPRSKIPTPLGILSEKNIGLFRGGVRANVWRWERERETHKIGIPQP